MPSLVDIEWFLSLAGLVGGVWLILWLGKREERQKAARVAAARAHAAGPSAAERRAPSKGSAFRLRIDRLDDGPDAVERALPLTCTYVRELPGDDRPDYQLYEVEPAIVWKGEPRRHAVLAARIVGARIGRGSRDLPVGIAIATDPAIADATRLRMDAVDYVAIGFATHVDT